MAKRTIRSGVIATYEGSPTSVVNWSRNYMSHIRVATTTTDNYSEL